MSILPRKNSSSSVDLQVKDFTFCCRKFGLTEIAPDSRIFEKVSRNRRAFASVRRGISSLPEGNFENKYIGRTRTMVRRHRLEKPPRENTPEQSLSLSLSFCPSSVNKKKYYNTKKQMFSKNFLFSLKKNFRAREQEK